MGYSNFIPAVAAHGACLSFGALVPKENGELKFHHVRKVRVASGATVYDCSLKYAAKLMA